MNKILVNSAGEQIEVEVVNLATKKGRGLYANYCNSYANYSLTCCYKNCSDAKREAFDKIRKEKISVSGYDIRITSYNSMQFTCAYQFIENAHSVWLIYHTKEHRYGVKIS